MKICLVCSHGGHLMELLQLLDAFEGHDTVLITYDDNTTRGLGTTYTNRTYFIKISSAKVFQLNFFQLLRHIVRLSLKEFQILLKEEPDIIITTGSEIAIPICYLGRILGKKIIFIESLSRVNDLSRTGKFLYPIATLFLVQWKHLAMKYKKSQYQGKIL